MPYNTIQLITKQDNALQDKTYYTMQCNTRQCHTTHTIHCNKIENTTTQGNVIQYNKI